jgi:hypothetical protein
MTDDNFRKHNYRVRSALSLTCSSIALRDAAKDGLLSECERETYEKLIHAVVTTICNAMEARCGRREFELIQHEIDTAGDGPESVHQI